MDYFDCFLIINQIALIRYTFSMKFYTAGHLQDASMTLRGHDLNASLNNNAVYINT